MRTIICFQLVPIVLGILRFRRQENSSKVGTFPVSWLAHFSRNELEASQKTGSLMAVGVKDAFRHAWNGYTQYASGMDDLLPISGYGTNWIDAEVTLIDSLSTLWLMDLKDEFEIAKQRVADISFSSKVRQSVFETTIRALGGLCSAHSLSGDSIFLEKARELADELLPCIEESSSCGGFGNLAERGTVQLEFRYISQQTGDSRYQAAADQVLKSLLPSSESEVNVESVGAGADSYYEYLLKVYLQAGKQEPELVDNWELAMEAMRTKLIKTTAKGSTFVSDRGSDEMEHLACFVGGMLLLGSNSVTPSREKTSLEALGANVTETCYRMCSMTTTGLCPERALFDINDDFVVDDWSERNANLLRPEVAESIYYAHYYTGDPKYRNWAADLFQALNRTARTEYGFAEVQNVWESAPRQKDAMQSYFLAETLTYLYLTLAPHDVIDLDKFVFNTEAHPVRVNSSAPITFT
eukprot:TRINITY_DN57365_c0_g1_i1.p1 TRINITY_DN57365_c0_g1~~TRINITY_DN57365_c0_g1_i1.p1  ORF type:complete len:468 (-),score=58.45 TRINITY_DN57365_c0_g1_i1:60-1463(-)